MIQGYGAILLAAVVATTASAAETPARCIARYADGQTGGDVLRDYSGFDHDTKLSDGAVLSRGFLDLTHGYVSLPPGRDLFGPRAARGAVAMWVRPAFDPKTATFVMFFYAMQTDGNALPDGYDEIGLYLDHGQLCARIVGPDASTGLNVPISGELLAQGKWTHLALSWGPGSRELYIDGKLIVRREGAFGAPRMDDFRAEVGRHPSSKSYPAPGVYAAIQIYDDALTAADMTALAAQEPKPTATEKPAPARVIAGASFGRIWPGSNHLQARVQGPADRQLQVKLRLEMSSGPKFERTIIAEPTVQVPAGGQGDIGLDYDLKADGPVRMEALAYDNATGAFLGGRVEQRYIPELLAPIAAGQKALADLAGQQLPADLKQRVAAAQDRVATLAKTFAAGPPTDPAEAEKTFAAMGKELAAVTAETASVADVARLATAAPGQPFALGWLHGSLKVLKQDPFPGELETPIVLESARREYEPAQLFVFARDAALEHVRVELSPLRGPGGAEIAVAEQSWRLVDYLTTTKPSYAVRYVGEWPDLLMPVKEFSVPARESRIVWLQVHVPAGIAPGDYTGEVAVVCAAGRRTMPIKLHVWDFDLPERASLPSAFGLNCMGALQSKVDPDKYARDAAEHRVSYGFPGMLFPDWKVQTPSFDWSGSAKVTFSLRGEGAGIDTGGLHLVCETRDGLRTTYGPFAPKAVAAEVSADLHEPTVFQSLRFEWHGSGPVKIEIVGLKLSGGQKPARTLDDFTHPDYWRGAILRGGSGAQPTMTVAGGKMTLTAPAPDDPAKPWDNWPGAVRAASSSPAELDWKIDFTAWDAAVEKYYPWAANVLMIPLPGVAHDASLEEAHRQIDASGLAHIAAAAEKHLAEKGWLDVAYTYLWDEPEPGQYPVVDLLDETVHKAAPHIKNMMTARGFPPGLKHVDIWCPEIYSFDPVGAERERKLGRTIWWYVAFSCRHPYPNFWIDYPAIDCRATMWLTWKHRISCFLYWSATNWGMVDDPFKQQTFPGANGDGTLIYPGPDGAPIDTIRWENIREGMEDYEYFVLLKARLEAAEKAGKLKAGQAEKAKALLAIDDGLVRDYTTWSSDPEAYLAARREMARMIEVLR